MSEEFSTEKEKQVQTYRKAWFYYLFDCLDQTCLPKVVSIYFASAVLLVLIRVRIKLHDLFNRQKKTGRWTVNNQCDSIVRVLVNSLTFRRNKIV